MLYHSIGTISYQYDAFPKVVCLIDREIARYYQHFIPKYVPHNSQAYPPHITIMRTGKEKPNFRFWKVHEGKKVGFNYSPLIYQDGVYFYMDCFSVELENIRQELGLELHQKFHQPPPGFRHTFHFTLANTKGMM
jgi:hypothetical protein